MTSLRTALADGLVMARRNLSHVRHEPEQLMDVTVQPFVFVLLFAYVFGGAVVVHGVDYKAFLIAGIFVQTLAFGTMGAAVSMAEDMRRGVIDRFRSLPMARSAVLVGRAVADLGASAIGLTVLAATGLLVGWGIETGVGDAIAGFALLLLFAFAMSWVGTLLGLVARSAEVAQQVVFIVVLPLTFVSNAFVPPQTMPGALRTFAEWNPISAVVAACRQLFGNGPAAAADAAWPLQHPVVAALAWIALILAVAAPLAVRRYRSATGR
jgi:ABC-2 type transport system permease protein